MNDKSLCAPLVEFLDARGCRAEVSSCLMQLDLSVVLVVGSVAAGSTTSASDLDLLAITTMDAIELFEQSLGRSLVSTTSIGLELLGNIGNLEVNLEVVSPAVVDKVLAPAVIFAAAVANGTTVSQLPIPGERELRLAYRVQSGTPALSEGSQPFVDNLAAWRQLLIALYVITALDFLEDATAWVTRSDDYTWQLMLQEAREATAFATLSSAGSFCPQRKWLARELQSPTLASDDSSQAILRALFAPMTASSISETANHVDGILHRLGSDHTSVGLGSYLQAFVASHYSPAVIKLLKSVT